MDLDRFKLEKIAEFWKYNDNADNYIALNVLVLVSIHFENLSFLFSAQRHAATVVWMAVGVSVLIGVRVSMAILDAGVKQVTPPLNFHYLWNFIHIDQVPRLLIWDDKGQTDRPYQRVKERE